MTLGRTLSGRTRVGRSDTRRSYCLGCDVRITKGDPKPTSSWPAALSLTERQCDFLLQAAAEFIEIGGGSPVDFVDWMSIDALRDSSVPLLVEHDGAPGTRDNRHPFPLPQAGRLTR